MKKLKDPVEGEFSGASFPVGEFSGGTVLQGGQFAALHEREFFGNFNDFRHF